MIEQELFKRNEAFLTFLNIFLSKFLYSRLLKFSNESFQSSDIIFSVISKRISIRNDVIAMMMS